MLYKDFYSKKDGYCGSISIGSQGLNGNNILFAFDWYFGQRSIAFFIETEFSYEFVYSKKDSILSIRFGPFSFCVVNWGENKWEKH